MLKKQTPWPESAASELYRTSDRRLSGKLVPTFLERGVVCSALRIPFGRNVGFLDRSRYFFFQIAHYLYSRGWMDPFPDLLLLRKFGSTENGTRTPESVVRNWPLDHRGGQSVRINKNIIESKHAFFFEKLWHWIHNFSKIKIELKVNMFFLRNYEFNVIFLF
jgi:hypothetical protein